MNPGTVEVRIRSHQEAAASYLTHWPITNLARLVKEVTEWGYEVDGDTDGHVFGQFSVGGDSYFEIVVGVD